jgi:hypothetical protein
MMRRERKYRVSVIPSLKPPLTPREEKMRRKNSVMMDFDLYKIILNIY